MNVRRIHSNSKFGLHLQPGEPVEHPRVDRQRCICTAVPSPALKPGTFDISTEKTRYWSSFNIANYILKLYRPYELWMNMKGKLTILWLEVPVYTVVLCEECHGICYLGCEDGDRAEVDLLCRRRKTQHRLQRLAWNVGYSVYWRTVYIKKDSNAQTLATGLWDRNDLICKWQQTTNWNY